MKEKEKKANEEGGVEVRKVRQPQAPTDWQTDTHHFSELITP